MLHFRSAALQLSSSIASRAVRLDVRKQLDFAQCALKYRAHQGCPSHNTNNASADCTVLHCNTMLACVFELGTLIILPVESEEDEHA